MGEAAQTAATVFAEQLRDQLPGLRLISHCGGGSFKSQFKRADRSGARWTLILGEDEVAQQQIGVKTMATGEQQTLTWQALADFLKQSSHTK